MQGFNLADISDLYYGNIQCSALYKGSTEIWRGYRKKYLTIESLEDNNTIGWECHDIVKNISYSIDNGNTWNTVFGVSGSNVTITTLNSGDKVLIKGTNNTYGDEEYANYSKFTSTKTFDAYGNIMSLIYGDNFIDKTTFPDSSFTFYSLFDGSKIVNANNLILPATTLMQFCYRSMFSGCTSLTTAPELPALTLNNWCYQNMFQGCTSLTTAPELPALTLADYCYWSMFEGCTSLTEVPELPATTLNNKCYTAMFSGCTSLTNAPELPALRLSFECYRSMFSGCTSLTTAPELPATTLAESCYTAMFSGCTNLTTAPELPATTLKILCYAAMFNGCTSLTNAPELPATTLVQNCYQYMFRGCTSLTIAPELPATTLASYCYQDMFNGCTSLTTAPELPATTLNYYCYNGMFLGCTNLNYIKAMFTTDITNTNNYTWNWVQDVSANGTFVKNRNAAWNVTGNNGVPTGWTVETA